MPERDGSRPQSRRLQELTRPVPWNEFNRVVAELSARITELETKVGERK